MYLNGTDLQPVYYSVNLCLGLIGNVVITIKLEYG